MVSSIGSSWDINASKSGGAPFKQNTGIAFAFRFIMSIGVILSLCFLSAYLDAYIHAWKAGAPGNQDLLNLSLNGAKWSAGAALYTLPFALIRDLFAGMGTAHHEGWKKGAEIFGIEALTSTIGFIPYSIYYVVEKKIS